MAKKKLNIGMIGYGFMGRAHSNAFAQVGHADDVNRHDCITRRKAWPTRCGPGKYDHSSACG